MAKAISEEELQLRKRARRRLIGAIALVIVVAIFLPMVLDHEPKPVKQDINIQIPSPDSGTFTSKIVPVTPPAKPDDKSAAAPAPAPDTPATTPDTAAKPETPATPAPYDTEAAPPASKAETSPAKSAAVAKPAVKAPPVAKAEAKTETITPPAKSAAKAEVKAEPAKSKASVQEHSTASAKAADKTAAPAGSQFVIQVAALSDAAKAKQMQQQISSAGIKSYTEVVPTQKGSVTRVRAGPYGSREAAEKVRDKLKGLGIAGNIVPKNP